MSNTNPTNTDDQTYEKALAFVLKWEGGYVNDPDDPGGATNKGVTQKVFNDYLTSLGQPDRSVQVITDQEVRAIYQQNYWHVAHCNELPQNLAIAQFDTAVNMGDKQAVLFLQQALGIIADGIYGPQTAAAVKNCNIETTINQYLNFREQRYRKIAKTDNMGKFLNGWLNRLNALREIV